MFKAAFVAFVVFAGCAPMPQPVAPPSVESPRPLRLTPPAIVSRSEPRESVSVRPGGYKLVDLPVFSKSLFYVRENYYDQRRLVWRRMLLGALSYLQRDVPEVVVEPLPFDDPDRVVVTVGDESRTFPIARVTAPWSLRTTLQDILAFVHNRLRPVPAEHEGQRLLDIEIAATNGMLSTLDPQSVLLDPETYGDMRTYEGPAPGGVGLVLVRDPDGRVFVSGTLPGSPAEQGGLKARDWLVRVDGVSPGDLTLADVVARLRGPIDSGVDLVVETKGARGPRTVHLTRTFVSASSVTPAPRILTVSAGPGRAPVKVGYVDLVRLGADAAMSVMDALGTFEREGVAGIVLDLRNNQGGLYEQAARVADAFIKDGTLVSMVDVDKTKRKDETARDGGPEPDLPLAVLVSRETASGGEIIAAALRNLGRAIVIGQHTYGQGTVQVLFDVTSPLQDADGSPRQKLGLKLTTAHFLAPGDQPIHKTGVAPDVEVRAVEVTSAGRGATFRMDPPRTPAVTIGPTIADVRRPATPRRSTWTITSLAPPLVDDVTARPVPGDDFTASFAAELLARSARAGRVAALAAAKTFAAEVATREDARVTAALGAANVDWRTGPRSSAARLALTLQTVGAGELQTGGSMRLRGTVVNSGSGPAFRVRASLASDNQALNGKELPFGAVAPGQTKTFDLEVPIPTHTFTRLDLVQAHLRDDEGEIDAPEVETTVAIRGHATPSLSFIGRAIARPSATDASLQVTLTIKNDGPGAATSVEATVYPRANHPLSGPKFKVSRWSGVLAAGASKDVTFAAELPIARSQTPVALDIAVGAPELETPVTASVIVTPDGDLASRRWRIVPQDIVASPPLVTASAPSTAGQVVHVTGEIVDDAAVQDITIKVWNRRSAMPVRKVFYRAAATNTARLPFEADISLLPGSNVIQVFGRDAQGTQALRTLVVLSTSGAPPR